MIAEPKDHSSIMSDEESFVILGTSPMSSLCSNHEDILQQARLEADGSHEYSDGNVASKSLASGIDLPKTDESLSQSIKSNSAAIAENSLKTTVMRNSASSSIANRSTSANSSLAASFILGEVDADVLKTSVYSQFPSICSMEACAEDVVKLQTFMSEYVELKNTLAKVNLTLKQFYEKSQQWKQDIKRQEDLHNEQLQDCQRQIALLRNENMELKREVSGKIEDLRIISESNQLDHAELIKSLSEKNAQLANMRQHIEKLEQQQLATFEYIPKNRHDSKEKPDYVDRLEHQRVVKEMERQLSQLLAENLDLKDVQKQYTDEINCLRVNLTAAEEMIKQQRSDIALLQAKDMEKSQIFSEYDNDRRNMREELELLRQQVEVYSKDFEIERIARQTLAGERDGLLQDLRQIQRKNQELIEAAANAAGVALAYSTANSSSATAYSATISGAQRETTPPSTAIQAVSTRTSVPEHRRPIRSLPLTSEAASAMAPAIHRCPICSKTFRALTVLQSHVNDCLDKN